MIKSIHEQITDYKCLLDNLLDNLTYLHQLKFLLAEEPMIDAPENTDQAEKIRSPYIYIHPKTLARLFPISSQHTNKNAFTVAGGNIIRWISTPLMPDERIICSPNLFPGVSNE